MYVFSTQYSYDVGTYEPQSVLIYLYHNEYFLEVLGFVAASDFGLVASLLGGLLGSLRVSKGSGVDVAAVAYASAFASPKRLQSSPDKG